MIIVVGGILGIVVAIIYVSICNGQLYSQKHTIVGFYIFLVITLLFSTIHITRIMSDIKDEMYLTVMEEFTSIV